MLRTTFLDVHVDLVFLAEGMKVSLLLAFWHRQDRLLILCFHLSIVRPDSLPRVFCQRREKKVG